MGRYPFHTEGFHLQRSAGLARRTECPRLAPSPSVMLGGLAVLIDMESSPSLLRLIQFRQVFFRVDLELFSTWFATEFHFLILVHEGNRITPEPKDIIRNQTRIQRVRFPGNQTSSSTSGYQHQDQTEKAIFQAHFMSPLECLSK